MIAIDLGSNTLRVLEYDCTTSTSLTEYSKVVKSADGLAKYGYINDKAIGRIIDALKEAQGIIDFSNHNIRAVTTQAVRVATNKESVLSQISEATGVEFEIISGDMEAMLTLGAIKHRLDQLDINADNFVSVDIGGGSTEIIFDYLGETISRSFPIGIVTIAQSFDCLEDIAKELPSQMIEIREFCDEVYDRRGRVESFVATAGTPTTVASMKLDMTYATYDASKINGTTIDLSDLDYSLDTLLSYTPIQREIVVGVGRYDLILAGILIYKEIFDILGFGECVVVDDGLREGVAIYECNR